MRRLRQEQTWMLLVPLRTSQHCCARQIEISSTRNHHTIGPLLGPSKPHLKSISAGSSGWRETGRTFCSNPERVKLNAPDLIVFVNFDLGGAPAPADLSFWAPVSSVHSKSDCGVPTRVVKDELPRALVIACSLQIQTGSCWLIQWKEPNPQINSVESTPMTFRSKNSFCKICRALLSLGER
jgi:hypothetical protein